MKSHNGAVKSPQRDGGLSIDPIDGGEDDIPMEHANWAKQLEELGRNPKMPWKRQLETIEIDAEWDYIGDQGDEVWSILEARGIPNVILTGVHVNMCARSPLWPATTRTQRQKRRPDA